MTEEGEVEYELIDYDKLLAHYVTSDRGVLIISAVKTPVFVLFFFFCLRIYESNIIPDHSTYCNCRGNSESEIAKQSQRHN